MCIGSVSFFVLAFNYNQNKKVSDYLSWLHNFIVFSCAHTTFIK